MNHTNMVLYITENTKKVKYKKAGKQGLSCANNKDVDNQYVKMYCATNQFSELKILGPHKKHVVYVG